MALIGLASDAPIVRDFEDVAVLEWKRVLRLGRTDDAFLAREPRAPRRRHRLRNCESCPLRLARVLTTFSVAGSKTVVVVPPPACESYVGASNATPAPIS